MVQHGKTGFIVEPGSSEALRRGILDLLALSDDERQRFGEEGRRHVLANFTWPIVAKKTLDLCAEAIASRR
jgi:glycosyltransferase involved in cell wall biosynthesis